MSIDGELLMLEITQKLVGVINGKLRLYIAIDGVINFYIYAK